MSFYPMYHHPSSASPTHTFPNRVNSQETLQAMSDYYRGQGIPQQQMSDNTRDYRHPFTTTYGAMNPTYQIGQGAYAVTGAITQDLHYTHPHQQHIMPTMVRGMDEPDTTTARPRLTPDQQQDLKELFAQNPKPTTQQKMEYARRFALSKNRVDNWFQNQRAKTKTKKHAAESNDAKTPRSTTSASDESPSRRKSTEPTVAPTLGNAIEPQSMDDLVEASQQTTWGPMPSRTRQDIGQSDYVNTTPYSGGFYATSDSHNGRSPMTQEDFDFSSFLPPTGAQPTYSSEALVRQATMIAEHAVQQTLQMPSNNTPTRETFDNVTRPIRSFADRRAQRPAALNNMQSYSSSHMQGPHTADGIASRAPRQKSASTTALNKGYRVRKSSATNSQQQSPAIRQKAVSRSYNSTSPIDTMSSMNIENLGEMNAQGQEVGMPFWSNSTFHQDFTLPLLSGRALTIDDGSLPHTPPAGQTTFGTTYFDQGNNGNGNSASYAFTESSPVAGSSMQEQCMQAASQEWHPEQLNQMFTQQAGYDVASDAASLPQHEHNAMVGQSNDDQPSGIEFTPGYQGNTSTFYLPLKPDQNYVFQMYQPGEQRP